MNGQMKKYRESLVKMPEPVLLSQCPKIQLDLRGLMQYAKNKGVKVIELTEKETAVFLNKSIDNR